jgi:NAD(P)-dependent dehydrogenase (short-subunit alcohol dehydrogenase family)
VVVSSQEYLQSLFGVTDRVAVVTGAADGLGKAMALAFAKADAIVVLADVNEERLRDALTEVHAISPRAIARRTDVSSVDDVGELFATVEREFGRVDVLVNNAGVLIDTAPPESYPLADWERTMAINLTGAFLCAQAAGRMMIASGDGGSIINMSSIGGVTALAGGILPYDVSKSGLNQLTRELAVEWAKQGVRVNSLAPCHFRTRGWAMAMESPEKKDAVDAAVRGIPMGRMGEPDEIVGAVLFLASDASSMVTGCVLPVDGGNLAVNATAGGVLRNVR